MQFMLVGQRAALRRWVVRRRRNRLSGLFPPLGALLLATALGCSGGAAVPSAGMLAEPTSFGELMQGVVGGRDAFRDDIREVDGFAGVYHEGCDVVVLVTDLSAEATDEITQRYRPMLQSMGNDGPCYGRVRLRDARFSWTQLSGWYHDSLRLDGLRGVTTHGINVVRNRIVVGVSSDDAVPEVLDRLADARVPPEAVVIGITGPVPEEPLAYTLQVRAMVADPPTSVAGARVLVLRDSDTVAVAWTVAPAGAEIEVPGPGSYHVVLDRAAGYRLHPRQPAVVKVNVFRRHPPAEVGFYLLPTR